MASEYSEGYLSGWHGDVQNAAEQYRKIPTDLVPWSFVAGAQNYEEVSISGGGFNALSPPSGTKGMTIILPTAGSTKLVLKGLTADTGIPVSGANLPVVTFGFGDAITNALGFNKTDWGTITVEIFWW